MQRINLLEISVWKIWVNMHFTKYSTNADLRAQSPLRAQIGATSNEWYKNCYT